LENNPDVESKDVTIEKLKSEKYITIKQAERATKLKIADPTTANVEAGS